MRRRLIMKSQKSQFRQIQLRITNYDYERWSLNYDYFDFMNTMILSERSTWLVSIKKSLNHKNHGSDKFNYELRITNYDYERWSLNYDSFDCMMTVRNHSYHKIT
jgi:hypothetical protein